jgi:hypothetical protein
MAFIKEDLQNALAKYRPVDSGPLQAIPDPTINLS